MVLNAVGFPSGVAGVPAEVIESLSPVVMRRRQLRPDSGGAGEWRGGLGQLTEFSRRGEGRWSVSSIADRTEYAAPGLRGGGEGAKGEVLLNDGTRLHAKAMVDLKNDDIVHVNLPGGGGYGNALERAPEKVLWDVVEGYVSAEEAEQSYGVVVRYKGESKALVKLPSDWEIDEEQTRIIREKLKNENRKAQERGLRMVSTEFARILHRGGSRSEPLRSWFDRSLSSRP